MNTYRRKRRRQSPWIVRQFFMQPKPLWIVMVLHLAALGLALLIFALPHHVIPRSRASMGVVSSRDAMVQTAAQETAMPAELPADTAEGEIAAEITGETEAEAAAVVPQSTAAPTRVGDFSAKFADKFAAPGEVTYTDNTYISENVNVTITEYYENNVRYYAADIYVRDISCFRTGFAKGEYGRNITEEIINVAAREQSVMTINGDFYGFRTGGVCARNGELYYIGDIEREVCVLYWDGSMKCFMPEDFDYEHEMANGAYQIWNFGPAVLDENGQARTQFSEEYEGITDRHPRTAVGYYEPGHYCFLVVDGRTQDSRGLTLEQLAATAQSLGLKQCYNLDGGRTSQMALCTAIVNHPLSGGRNCSDYLTIVDKVVS